MLKTYSEFWYRFKKDKLAVAGSIIVICLFVLSFIAPLVAPYDPNAIDARHVLTPPGTVHLFGTDDLGRDVFSRVL
jgi:peptide/nickel transport system permease protein